MLEIVLIRFFPGVYFLQIDCFSSFDLLIRGIDYPFETLPEIPESYVSFSYEVLKLFA